MQSDRFTVEYDQPGAFHGSWYPFKVYDIEAEVWDRPVASFHTAQEAWEYVERRLQAAQQKRCICWEMGATGEGQVHTICPADHFHRPERLSPHYCPVCDRQVEDLDRHFRFGLEHQS